MKPNTMLEGEGQIPDKNSGELDKSVVRRTVSVLLTKAEGISGLKEIAIDLDGILNRLQLIEDIELRRSLESISAKALAVMGDESVSSVSPKFKVAAEIRNELFRLTR